MLVQHLKKAVLLTLVMIVICGLLYPIALTGVSQLVFPHQANGSFVEVNGQKVGSALVGQKFTDPRYFKCRPSAVNYNTYTDADITPDAEGNVAYGGPGSGSNNYGPSNPALTERVQADMDAFLAANPTVKKEDIPTDLLTGSGSGLDPNVSPASARVQIPAIAQASGLSEARLAEIVDANTDGKILGIFGEERVNVLGCNLEIAKELGVI